MEVKEEKGSGWLPLSVFILKQWAAKNKSEQWESRPTRATVRTQQVDWTNTLCLCPDNASIFRTFWVITHSFLYLSTLSNIHTHTHTETPMDESSANWGSVSCPKMTNSFWVTATPKMSYRWDIPHLQNILDQPIRQSFFFNHRKPQMSNYV